MGTFARTLASGPGWQVSDVVCTAGPCDRPFEERHDFACIALVTDGSFQYRSTQGRATLAPGGLLLGDQGACFECGHAHGIGDRCLAFQYSADRIGSILSGVPGARQDRFSTPHLPPLEPLMPLIAAAEAARNDGDQAELEELSLRFVGAVAATLADTGRRARVPSERDERRITIALRRIEAHAHESLPLAELAHEAAMSPYHFLRTFRQIVGMTPHQFLLRTRLHRAAVQLRRSNDPISSVAFDAGFDDLSTFNRRFRRLIGINPVAYRARSAIAK